VKVTQKKVTELIPYVNNSRTHSDEQVAQIAASIKEFGWTNPILIDGDNGIIAGHGRLLAARKLQMTDVPTIELKDLSESQKKAYIIADNKLALNADWDKDLLRIEIEELVADDYELSKLGFNQEELDALLGEFAADAIEEIDEINEAVNFIIKCENIAQKEIIKAKLGISSEKITFDTFMAFIDG
jgi:ParB-like chromosome segregation protein Spo0J